MADAALELFGCNGQKLEMSSKGYSKARDFSFALFFIIVSCGFSSNIEF
jgi:hypothetical protein